MSITFRQLEIFNAVVETSQVTRASKKLHLTQSAVSMALNELENQLGGPLFDRRGRSLLLNDRGRFLLPRSRRIIFEVENIEHLMREDSDTISGCLEIVASSTIGNYVLPYLIGGFMRLHEHVHINMQVFNTAQAEKMVGMGAVDFGFVEGDVSSEQVIEEPWFHDELVVVTSAEDPLGDKEFFSVPEDLEECNWIMREQGSGTAQQFKARLGEHAAKLRTVMELGHTEAIKKAVESGRGVGCLSSLAVYREVESGWLRQLRINGLDMRRQLTIITHRDKAHTRLMREFHDFCLLMRCEQVERASAGGPAKVLKCILDEMSQGNMAAPLRSEDPE